MKLHLTTMTADKSLKGYTISRVTGIIKEIHLTTLTADKRLKGYTISRVTGII